MEKFKIGKDKNGVQVFLTLDDLIQIDQHREGAKTHYNHQQWAKIRKFIKKYVK